MPVLSIDRWSLYTSIVLSYRTGTTCIVERRFSRYVAKYKKRNILQSTAESEGTGCSIVDK